MMSSAQIVSTVVISVIAASGAYLASRTAAKASMKNVSTSSRVEMEKEAYERARKLDTETIARQDKEMKELEEKLGHLNDDVKRVNQENEVIHEENQRILRESARLREINRDVLEANQELRTELTKLRGRVTRMQRGLHPDSTERIRERETDTNPMTMREVENGRE